jgi:hypothetical protein
VVWGCIEIYVHTRPRINPYFYLSVSNPSVGWWKEWFFLRNDTEAPLPMVTGKCPALQPSWGYRVAKKDTRKLQSVHDVLQSLLLDGLMGVDLLHTFISLRVQPLRRWEVTMWRYPEPSCLDCPFSAELADVEVDSQV